jgi:hypothetical protein
LKINCLYTLWYAPSKYDVKNLKSLRVSNKILEKLDFIDEYNESVVAVEKVSFFGGFRRRRQLRNYQVFVAEISRSFLQKIS